MFRGLGFRDVKGFQGPTSGRSRKPVAKRDVKGVGFVV